MNKRIYELALQAEMAANNGDHVDVKIMMAKFGALLIEECIACVRYTDKDSIFTAHDAGVVGAAHDRAMKAIRKHFGVEE